MDLKTFFDKLYPKFNNDENCIDILLFKNASKPVNRVFCNNTDEIIKAVESYNEQNKDIYFRCPELKNGALSGAKEDCAAFPFLYADIDPYITGKNKRKIPVEKKDLLKKVEDFEITPSIVVDSGHGYHLYWLLDKPIREIEVVEEALRNIQLLLKTDKRAKLSTQLLRVPNTCNYKNHTRKVVQVVKDNNIRYKADDIIKRLSALAAKIPSVEAVSYKDSNYNLIDKTSFDFTTKQKPENIQAENFTELLDLLKKKNIKNHLKNLPKNPVFSCLFHHDENPSANIYKDKKGYYYYKCFGCGAHYDIIGLYRKTTNKNFSNAIIDLANLYGISFSYKEFVIAQWEKYYQNAVFIEDFESLNYDQQYPSLYKLLRPRMKYLSLINQYALSKISSDKYSIDNHNVFFFSYQYFAAKYKLTSITLKRSVYIFALLGLIEKIDPRDVDPYLAKRANDYSKLKEMDLLSRKVKPVNFYIFPNLFERLEEAEKRAKVMLDNKFTVKHCTNKSFIISTFGEDIANQVYLDGRTISKRSKSIVAALETTLNALIEDNGYATKAQIVSYAKTAGRLKIGKYEKEKELDRNIGEMISKYNLMFVTPTKELTKKYNLKNRTKILIESS